MTFETYTSGANSGKNDLEEIGYGSFRCFNGTTSIVIPETTNTNGLIIRGAAFMQNGNVTSIELPKTLKRIEQRAFAENTKVTSITVKGTCPEVEKLTTTFTDDGLYTIDADAFNSLIPNIITLTFEGEAESDITAYRANAAFRRLLIKSVSEDVLSGGNYKGAVGNNLPNQKHADVIVKRQLKNGWCTLVLPFEITNAQLKETLGDDALVAYYTNVMGDNKTLRFETTTGNLAAGKVFIVNSKRPNTSNHVGSPVAESTNINTIENTYSIGNLWYKFKDVETKNGQALTTYGDADYNVGGTFIKAESIVPEKSYFILDNSMYTTEQVSKAHSLGFRGWFSYQKDGAVPAKELVMNIFDEFGGVTAIGSIDTDKSVDSVNNIYNLNGQRVRSQSVSTEGLAKGLYIVNGKKVIIK